MTDEIERRLTTMLAEAGEHADPAAARLRNPALAPRPSRRRAGWLVAVASGAAVTVVAVGLAVGISSMTGTEPPSITSAGGDDGVHPFWPLRVTERYARTFDQLTTTGRVTTPVPHTRDTPEPTLVTAAGPIRFTGATGVHLIAQRPAGVFVAVTGGSGGDGLFDVDFQLVAADNTRRTLHHAARAGSVAVSPDGATLAFTTWLSGADEAAVKLVDVASGRVVHELAGRFTQVVWASSTALVAGDETTSVAWRAPWTGPGERIPVRAGTAFTVGGGLLALDDASGCLQRLDANATVTAVNCDGWRSAGHVSPDGRRVALEWTSGSTTQYGFLDLERNEVRSWPVPGLNPAWLGPTDVLLTEADASDTPRVARCELTTETCVLVPEEDQVAADAAWIGS